MVTTTVSATETATVIDGLRASQKRLRSLRHLPWDFQAEALLLVRGSAFAYLVSMGSRLLQVRSGRWGSLPFVNSGRLGTFVVWRFCIENRVSVGAPGRAQGGGVPFSGT